MTTRIHFQGQIYSASEFSSLSHKDRTFSGLESGQSFIQFWLNNKQFFSQKSSGSTGKPTVHKIHRDQVEASAKRTTNTLEIPTSASALVCINMDYIGGKMMLARGLMYHWQLYITAPSSEPFDELPPDLNFYFGAMVPIQVERLLSAPGGINDLNRIKKLIVGGAAISPGLEEQLQALNCEVYSTYGMTETVSHVALRKINGPDRSPYFTLLPGIESELDDRGCLRLKADVTGNQWLQTNDLVEFVSSREFRLLGRADHVINSGGLKIQVEQLEEAISATDILAGTPFAIGSAPDVSLGEKIVLLVEKEDIDKGQILTSLKTLLPEYHTPKEIITVQQLPLTPSGKLDRQALKPLAQQEPGKGLIP